MIRRSICFAVALGLALSVGLPAGAAAADDQYVVVFENEAVDPAVARELVESLGGSVLRDHSDFGVAIVTSDEPNFGRRMAQAKGVIGVSADLQRETSWSRQLAAMESLDGMETLDGFTPLTVSGPPGGAARAATRSGPSADGTIPDPRQTVFWPFQWNMQIMGLNDVFEIPFYGIPEVKVAVLGAGIDYRHPDLVGKVDLALSRSFVESDDLLVQQLFPGEHPVADLAFHTTFAASNIACNVTFLGCIAPGVTLVGVKVLDKEEFGTIGDVVSGIDHASDVGAQVISIPFSMWGPADAQWDKIWNWGDPADRADIKAVRRAINHAHARGAVVVADVSTPFGAPGIDADADGDDVILPVQAGNKAVGIGSSGFFDTYGFISNYGFSLVDAVAPGGFVDPDNPPAHPREFIWGACSSFSQTGRLPDECKIENQPQFLIIIGPIVAAGHATGVAALIASRYGGTKPGAFIRQKLLHTAVDIETPGRDAFTGWGRVDALRGITE